MNYRLNKFKNISITEALIFINLIVFALMYFFNFEQYFIQNFSSINVKIYINKLTGQFHHSESIFSTNEYYRFLTANYLHGGAMHIMFNMMALYSLGQVVESLVGRIKFFIAYTLSGLAGAFLSSAMNLYLNPEKTIYSVGASGAVFGIAGCLVVLAVYRKSRGMDLFYQINYQPLVIMLALNLALGQMIDGIDNWGHIGGLVFGAFIGSIYSWMNNRVK